MGFVPAFLMSLFAGLSTGIGSLIALFVKKSDTRFLSFSLGLSAGVMICVSAVELIPESLFTLSDIHGRTEGTVITVVSFFAGVLISMLLNAVLPDERALPSSDGKNLMKTAVFTAVAVALHNFPEGVSTFMSSVYGLSTALPIVVAVAIHNIPEGISVSMPVFFATGSQAKAFAYSFISGLTEPLGAAAAYLFLRPFLNETVLNAALSAVAGIMIFISVDELLPTSRNYGSSLPCISGVLTGAAIMALSLILL